jgi:HSP20 family molecular chaperone IbpA
MVNFFDVFFTGADFHRNFSHKHKQNIFWIGDEDKQELTLEIHLPGFNKYDLKVSLVEEYYTKYLTIKDKETEEELYRVAVPNSYTIPSDCKIKDGIFRMKFRKYQDVEEINIL